MNIATSRLSALARKLADETEPLSVAEAQELLQLLIEQYRGKVSDNSIARWQETMLQ